jgi:hypothetical protein
MSDTVYLDDLFEQICASTGLDKLAVYNRYVSLVEAMPADQIEALGLPTPGPAGSLQLEVWEPLSRSAADVVRQRLAE